MRRRLVICGILLFLAAGTAAQTDADTDDRPDDATEDPRPGLITADSVLYGLDVAVDTALLAVGVKRASDVVHERASEALVATEADDTAAAERAIEEAHRTARIAHGVNGDGLGHAEQLLLEVRDKVPMEAQAGIDRAVGEIRQAQERFPTDVVNRTRELPETPEPATGGEQ